jgi:type I restriction enzyme R subunit
MPSPPCWMPASSTTGRESLQIQGIGHSFYMAVFALKVLRRLAGNWTFVVVTNRVELDDQIAKSFKTVGAVSQAESDQCLASSEAHPRESLHGNHRYVFTLIHKFQTPEALTDRTDAIVLTETRLIETSTTR